MEGNLLEQQLERLKRVKSDEWKEALDGLLRIISNLLHGKLVELKDGKKVMMGGYTKYGAHTSYRLGGDALYHYEDMVVEKLYDGSWIWQSEKYSLKEQLIMIANSIIPKEAEKYATQKKGEKKHGYNSIPVSMDVEWLGSQDGHLDKDTEFKVREDDGNELGLHETLPANDELEVLAIDTEETINAIDDTLTKKETAVVVKMTAGLNEPESKQELWETICQAAEGKEGNQRLREYVQTVGESKKLKEVRDSLGLKRGEARKMINVLKKIINKK